MTRRHTLHPLASKAPVVNLDALPRLLQGSIGKPRPFRPEVFDFCWASLAVVQLAGLFSKSGWRDTACADKHMHMKISIIAVTARRMDSGINSNAITVCDMLCHFCGKYLSFRGRQLRGKRKDDFPSKSSVFPFFCKFSGIPEDL